MHPTLMTMFAEERAQNLRAAATQRRRSVSRDGSHRRLSTFRRLHRAARAAHA
jgi:hypothetical protein